MPSMARQQIAGISVAAVPIASANLPDRQQPYTFPGYGSRTWSPPVSGSWKFVGWGPGANGGGGAGGSSGGYIEITRFLRTTDSVTIVTGRVSGTDTAVTFPNGDVATAARGGGGGGVASGGDVNINGTAGTSSGAGATGGAGGGTGGGVGGPGSGTDDGGAGAPANLPYRGGVGGDAALGGNGIGGVGAGGGGNGTLVAGGHGLVLAVLIRE